MLARLLVLSALASPPADVTAVGIVVSRASERSVAILRSEGRTRIVGVGDTAFGGRVAAIGPGAVCLEFGSEKVDLRLPGGAPSGGSASAATKPAPPPPTGPPEDPATPARTMARREVERRLAEEIPRILAETTLVPVTQEGHVAGFTLTRLPEGSLLTDAGLRAGDILMRVNDVPIDSLATLLGLWPRFQMENAVRAVVLRNGRPFSLAVTLR